MQHCTPEQLALAALREPLSAEDTAHLEACADCRAEVASLQRAVDLLAVPELAAPGAPDPFRDAGGAFLGRGLAEAGERDPLDFELDVDPVQQRP